MPNRQLQIFHNLKLRGSQKRSRQEIKRSIDINTEDLHDDQLEYYRTKEHYDPQIKEPMFDNIGEYEYLKPLLLLNKELYEKKYFSDIGSQYHDKFENAKLPLDSYTFVLQPDRDIIMYNYILCRPNIRIVMNKYDELNGGIQKGNIYYSKKIEMTQNMIDSLWYNLTDKINKTLKAGVYNFVIYESRNEIKGIYKTNNFYKTIELAQYILHPNSLNMLEYQNVCNIESEEFKESNLKFDTMRKFLYDNIDLGNINKFCIVAGTILYSYGIRKIKNINAIYLKGHETSRENEIFDLLNNNFFNNKTKFPFMNVGLLNTELWRNTYKTKNEKMLDYFGITNIEDIIIDQKNYYFYRGIKFYNLDLEIVRKLSRLENKGYTYSQYLNKIIKELPDIIMIYLNNPKLLSYFITNGSGLRFEKKFNIDIKQNTNQKDFHKLVDYIYENIKKYYTKHDYRRVNPDIIKKLIN